MLRRSFLKLLGALPFVGLAKAPVETVTEATGWIHKDHFLAARNVWVSREPLLYTPVGYDRNGCPIIMEPVMI